MDIGKEHYAQFVTFNTAGSLSSEIFQYAWIPLGKGLHDRGIENVIVSQKMNVPGEFNPYRCISKNWWDSKKALEIMFPDGVPVPATRGHITVSNVSRLIVSY